MLLLNRTLIRMAKGLWGWIFLITALKLGTLIGTALFASILSGTLGSLTALDMTAAKAGTAVLNALLTAVAMLVCELLTGEAVYRCTAKARQTLRTEIFSKVLELDVGNVERIGPVSAITSSVDGVEAMTVYYSQYLPGLLYSILAPIYLFFQLKNVSLPVAVVLFALSIVIMPVNNIYRKHIESLKSDYWNSLEDMTGYYLENVQGLTTFKLYGQDERRTDGLRAKAENFNRRIMDVMKVNFQSFLLTDGLIYVGVVLSTVIAGQQLLSGSISFASALMVLMLSFGFFSSVRQLMGATHSALAGVSAADKVEKLLAIDTTRPYHPEIKKESPAYAGIEIRHAVFSYSARKTAIRDVSLKIPRGKMTALVGLSGCGKSTIASLLMRFSDLESGSILIDGQDYTSIKPEDLRKKIIMVPQYVSLFSGTIAENLRIAAPNATDEELLQALSDVRLKDWVTAQPEG